MLYYSGFTYIRRSLKFRGILLPQKECAISPWGQCISLYKLWSIVFYSIPTFWYRHLLVKCCLADDSLRHYIGHPQPKCPQIGLIYWIYNVSYHTNKPTIHNSTCIPCWWVPGLAICTDYPEVFTLHSQFRSLYSYYIKYLNHIYNIQKKFCSFDACGWHSTIILIFVTFTLMCHTVSLCSAAAPSFTVGHTTFHAMLLVNENIKEGRSRLL